MEKIPLSCHIRPDLSKRLRAAADKSKSPYAPTITAIVERGIELALEELKERNK